MGTHIRLYKDSSYEHKFRDVAAGTIGDYSGLTVYSTDSATVNDTTYYIKDINIDVVLSASVGSVMLQTSDALTATRDTVPVYWPRSLSCQMMAFSDAGPPPDSGVGFGWNWYWAGTQLFYGASTGSGDEKIYAYDINIDGSPFVLFTNKRLFGGETYVAGKAVSANIFEDSLQPRFGDDTTDDADSGYGDGEGGDGEGDTDAPTDNAMPIGGSGIHAYKITDGTYNSITAKLWGVDDNIFTALWYKFQNFRFTPIAGIINCIRIPSQFTPSGSDTSIQLAGLVLDDHGDAISSQYVSQQFSTANVFSNGRFPAYFGDYNDDSGTRITLHLPFCGSIDLAPSAVCGRMLVVTYWCDVLTGNVSARVVVGGGAADPSGGSGNGGGFIAQGSGNCAYSVPMSGNDNGMGDKLATVKSFATGQINGAASILAGGNPSIGDLMSGSTPSLAAGMFLAKHTTSVVGSLGGGVGLISDLAVRITTERVVPAKPANYQTTKGFMSVTGGTVGSYTGFTVFSSVNVSVAGATDEEKYEIERLLKEGVYI